MTEPADVPSPAWASEEFTPVALSSLRAGAVVRFRRADLDAGDVNLLRALGLTRECQFTIRKTGEPCIVQVRSTRIGLSRRVADGIFVVPDIHGA